ncbi:unnamed protein product [Linum tenue]|uniref:Uncharacterized protein n=1 Tax=Linum tenue TaxID=586396 RepID=A0AAV0MVW5_9ROSI|nr:unnamed protein product [Linum tenue]
MLKMFLISMRGMLVLGGVMARLIST